MSPTLLRGRWVIPRDPSRPSVIDDGALLVEDGVISEVGGWTSLRWRYPDAEVLGSDRHAVLPGLINAHHHGSGITTVQHGIADDLLEPWLLALLARRPADPYLETLVSSARLLRSGITGAVEVHLGAGAPEEFEERITRRITAYERSGMRVAFGIGLADQSHLVWGEDEAFLASLPDPVRASAMRLLPGPSSTTADDYFIIFDRLWRRYADHPRLRLWLAPPGPQWCSDALLLRSMEAAERYDTRLQMHLLESPYEKLHGLRAYGKPSVLHLRDIGFLGPRLTCAHCVWLTEPEIAALADAQVSVSHNPSSNLRLRVGIAPLAALIEGGVNVGLGMDGTTMADDDDIFAEIRLALRLHRTATAPGPPLSAASMLDIATAGGARLLEGPRTGLGLLAAGHPADAVLVRLDGVLWPWVAPEADPVELIVARARAGHVSHVMVGGELVLSNGRPLRFDAEAAAHELAAQLGAERFPTEMARVAGDLRTRLQAHYRGWGPSDAEPYTAYNSRR